MASVSTEIPQVAFSISRTEQVVSPALQSPELGPLPPPQRRTRSVQVCRNSHPILHVRGHVVSRFPRKKLEQVFQCKEG